MRTIRADRPGVDMVIAAQRGDRKALDTFLAQYLPLLYNIIGRALNGHADTDDVVQESMLRAVRANVTSAMLAQVRGEGHILLGFNEPDLSSQSNLTVSRAPADSRRPPRGRASPRRPCRGQRRGRLLSGAGFPDSACPPGQTRPGCGRKAPARPGSGLARATGP